VAETSGTTSGTIDATPETVWYWVADGGRLVSWWPRAERAEDVQGGRFTLVLRSSRGVPVRVDGRVSQSRREQLQRWEQELDDTPFAKAMRRSAVELRIEPAEGERSLVTVTVERDLVQRGLTAGMLGRRAARRYANELLTGLRRAATS
jgi:uncharacterized protein YndB with AHSA1/START domain